MKYTYSGNPKRPSFKVVRALVNASRDVRGAYDAAVSGHAFGSESHTIRGANLQAHLYDALKALESAENAATEEI